MTPIEELVRGFQALVAQVPELVQPFVVMLAGAVPFIEGEGGGAIGIVGGLNPIVAGVAAAIGNFLAVLAVVTLTARTRQAVVTRRSSCAAGGVATLEADEPEPAPKPESKGKQRFKRWVVRFGVPGASLLGPAAIPTHFTAAMLAGSGVPRGWVLLWQAIAIALWTIVITTIVWLGVTALLG
ncbi:hypothetical protein SAMN04487783_1129 [Agrococcus baldri]|uniref:Small multidrug efflux protein n=1 Tax=Agrococcus baldri TaxID=153730 RepID=A0AA94HLW0_9MICO|nr:small multidrug efflux protein [Agrococcus baldri]SFS08618.1 hypothetical protein SAMN04487783_1129 [Agrococcus baldri]